MTPLETVKLAYDAYAKREFDRVFSLFHPEVEFVQTEMLPWGGRYHGPSGAASFFERLSEYTEATPTPIAFVPAGSDVAVWGRFQGKARKTGTPIDLAIVHLWSVQDGLVTRFAAYIDTPAMLKALGQGQDEG